MNYLANKHAYDKLWSLISLGVTTPMLNCQLRRIPQELLPEVLDIPYPTRTLLDRVCNGECPAPQSLGYVETLLNFGSLTFSEDHGESSLWYASRQATRLCGAGPNIYSDIIVKLIDGGAFFTPNRNTMVTISIINSLLRAPKDPQWWDRLHAEFSMNGIDDIIDNSDMMGFTPLGTACLMNDKDAVEHLVDIGAEIEKVMHVNGIMMTAIDICWAHRSDRCLEYLLRSGGLFCISHSLTMFISSEALMRRMHDKIKAAQEDFRRSLVDAHVHGNVREVPDDLAKFIVDLMN